MFTRFSRTAMIFTATSIFSVATLQAQTSGRNDASNGAIAADPASSPASTSTPSISNTKTVQWHETVVPADKQISAKVTSGVLTVDGLVAKVHLNYDIHHASYMYFFVPGVGTAVVSRVEMYGGTKIPGALHGDVLAFNVDGHDFELSSESALEGKGTKTDMYVRLDTATTSLDRMPMIGFGTTTHAPYAWPLSGVEAKDSQAHFIAPPPMPASLLPRTVPSAATTPVSNGNAPTIQQ